MTIDGSNFNIGETPKEKPTKSTKTSRADKPSKEKVIPVKDCTTCNGDPDISPLNLPQFGGTKCDTCFRVLSYFKKIK